MNHVTDSGVLPGPAREAAETARRTPRTTSSGPEQTVANVASDDYPLAAPGEGDGRGRPPGDHHRPAPTVDRTVVEEPATSASEQGERQQSRRRTRGPRAVEDLFTTGGSGRATVDAEVDRVVERLYREIERRMRIERERRGL